MTVDAEEEIKKLLKLEDAVKFLAFSLKEQVNVFRGYGYDVYVSSVIEKWLNQYKAMVPKVDGWNTNEHYLHNIPYLSAVFYDAAWELCRLGVLRPGVTSFTKQSTDQGNGGGGFSITFFGKQWLIEISSSSIFFTTEPGRFSEMTSPFSEIFGENFRIRSNEAIRCYGAHAYLACCVMCGAAAELIFLCLAIKKDGDVEKVLKVYRKSNGRKRIEDFILQAQKDWLKNDFALVVNLLKYWRDEAAHGYVSVIGENEAYTSLGLLLRCAQVVKDNYAILSQTAVLSDH